MNNSTKAHTPMTPAQLRDIVLTLPAHCPITDAFESPRSGNVWYATQKEHLTGWLAEYNGPGAYGRKNHDRDARAFYQHFRCAPGLLWLAEALGEDPEVLRTGVAAIQAAGSNLSSQCAAFRRTVPWERIEELIETHEARRSRTVKARVVRTIRRARKRGGPPS
ncbi:hypothetical protein [Rhodococcus spongiicola]|uniref:hypothetical protein n=1 Tax=Rhodococcus spongiicola TaxID=2487352 RepID=UPI0019D45CB2|nr:hypothetical protein [Rhodococcus spongiicola]